MPDLVAIESRFLDARDARDALEVAQTRGTPVGGELARLEARVAEADAAFVLALAEAPDRATLAPEDQAALGHILEVIEAAGFSPDGTHAEGVDDPSSPTALAAALGAAFRAAGDSLTFDGAPIGRLSILKRLGSEPDASRRRELFLALEPLWRAVDGDGLDASPYRALARAAAPSASAALAAAAEEVGIEPQDLEGWCVAILEAWRDANRDAQTGPIEPWDWWWSTSEAERLVGDAVPVARLLKITKEYVAALGADLDALRVGFDIEPRPDRPSIPVAMTTFGSRPRQHADGTWTPARPWVFATYRDGGLGELTELVHETVHALHVAGIRARPAFADWPASDTFTEALAEVLALDTAEPAWLGRWVDPALAALPQSVSIRSRYADVALDAAWGLFEIRALAAPEQRPNDIWTSITSEWLGIAPHPEWSWWAIRGQLAGSPGYMINYGIGAVLAADMRAAIRGARGDWLAGDPGWYGWVSERLYRFGASRSAADVLRHLLGRRPSLGAILAELARIDA